MGARAQHVPAYRHMCKLLRQWRETASLTQRGLGQRLHKPYSFVWKVEAGERRIDPIEFVAWCRACDMPPAEGIQQLDA